MTGEERRELIVAQLKQADTPLSASAFAKEFGVSRQIIVGDVALIRAAGLSVRATAKGYVLEEMDPSSYRGQVVCQHQLAETEAELSLIVGLGGVVADVSVDHPIYGELTGNLDIRTAEDVTAFIERITANNARLLLNLTGGIHLHTLVCHDQPHFIEIKEALAIAGLLYQEK
ncbi:transcription repressor NadR [uncultured Vagococcus sp.]|uniref:transcription repressor NadR n=1 Tax=uncultured Vagococcus sp. TaxID=189676 RepID=UPI0028D26DD0|nr:transcription repressor NadR [uncultured Vagococcus sp.]